MDRLEPYRQAVVALLRDMAEAMSPDDQAAPVVITDREHDHYQLLVLGWAQGERIFDPAVHISLRNGKVWIEQNTTPERVGELLIAAGVPRDQIVLAFQPAELRHLTDFAVA